MVESVKLGEDTVLQITDPVEALRLMARANMRPFTQYDWYGFSGCETREPMIGESMGFIIVMDGATLNVIHQEDNYGGTLFTLKGEDKC